MEETELMLGDVCVEAEREASLRLAVDLGAVDPGLQAMAMFDDNPGRPTARREQIRMGISHLIALETDNLGQIEPGQFGGAEGPDVVRRRTRGFPLQLAVLVPGRGRDIGLTAEKIDVEVLDRVCHAKRP